MWARRLLRAGLEGRDGGAGVDNAGEAASELGDSHRHRGISDVGCRGVGNRKLQVAEHS